VGIGSRLPAAKLWEAAARCKATGMSSVPAILYDLLAGDGAPPPGLRYVVTSSAPLPDKAREDFEQRFGIPLLVCYGLSEAGCFVSYSRTSPRSPVGAIGMPIGCEVAITGDEVVVRGPGLMEGYDGDPEATALALRDGWLHTGDCGRLDADGFLYLSGRLKDMINRGGEKIAPDAVEAVLRECPGLAEVAVFGVSDPRLGEEVAAAVIPAPGTAWSDEDFWDFCDGKLAEFETPKHWQRLPEFPRGATGKVLRRALREGFPS
jgi:acyl-CoA synthetase (AMP-forming)/AMP-acid ligase II